GRPAERSSGGAGRLAAVLRCLGTGPADTGGPGQEAVGEGRSVPVCLAPGPLWQPVPTVAPDRPGLAVLGGRRDGQAGPGALRGEAFRGSAGPGRDAGGGGLRRGGDPEPLPKPPGPRPRLLGSRHPSRQRVEAWRKSPVALSLLVGPARLAGPTWAQLPE